MRTARFEYKYLMTEPQAADVREWAEAYCVPDPYGDRGRYDVYSLYFDTWDARLAQQTLDGISDRYKARVRTYALAGGPMWAEVKRRSGATILKDRAPVDRDWVRTLWTGPSAAASTAGSPAFRALVDRGDLRPRVWVKYTRHAYASPYGDAARLTFDLAIAAQSVPADDVLAPHLDRWMAVPTAPALLELKFTTAFPAWMDRMTRMAGLRRVSFSKYVRSSLHTGELWERRLAWTV
jgi:hypothetical protein